MAHRPARKGPQQTVYHCVRNDRNGHVPFIANRVAEVHDIFNKLQQFQPEVWYIRTTDNPADMLTRVRTTNEFRQQFNFRIHGHAFLAKGEDSWPPTPEVKENEKEAELRKAFVSVNGTVPNDNEASGANSVAEYTQKTGHSNAMAEQLKVIKLDIIRKAQAAVSVKEIAELKNLPKPTENDVLPSKINSGLLGRKEVFLDKKEMLRVITRLDNANFVSTYEKRPLALPSRHPLT